MGYRGRRAAACRKPGLVSDFVGGNDFMKPATSLPATLRYSKALLQEMRPHLND